MNIQQWLLARREGRLSAMPLGMNEAMASSGNEIEFLENNESDGNDSGCGIFGIYFEIGQMGITGYGMGFGDYHGNGLGNGIADGYQCNEDGNGNTNRNGNDASPKILILRQNTLSKKQQLIILFPADSRQTFAV